MRKLLVIAGLLALPGAAWAQQTDYSAGKTPAQLFSGDCAACHNSPRGLSKGKDQSSLANFLREHYTTKAETAGALAAYLIGNPGPAPDTRNAGRPPRGTPASAPAAAAPPPKPADDDPIRRIFRSPSAEPEPEEGAIVAPEPGEKQKGKPRTAARPPAERAKDAAKDKDQAKEQAREQAKEKEKEKESAREAARPKKPDPAESAKAEAARAEEAAREAAAKEAVAKAEAAKAEAAAKVRAYTTGGEAAAPAPERPASTPPG